jgi:hypothetical protein
MRAGCTFGRLLPQKNAAGARKFPEIRFMNQSALLFGPPGPPPVIRDQGRPSGTWKAEGALLPLASRALLSTPAPSSSICDTVTCPPPSDYALWSHVLPTFTLPVADSAARGETALFFVPFGRMA